MRWSRTASFRLRGAFAFVNGIIVYYLKMGQKVRRTQWFPERGYRYALEEDAGVLLGRMQACSWEGCRHALGEDAGMLLRRMQASSLKEHTAFS